MKRSGHKSRVITYTDIMGTLMSSVTDIINMISYVLVAFISVSLIVSSIMDRNHNLHIGTGAQKGNWNSACNGCFEAKYCKYFQR